jgi:hypothetical protein
MFNNGIKRITRIQNLINVHKASYNELKKDMSIDEVIELNFQLSELQKLADELIGQIEKYGEVK